MRRERSKRGNAADGAVARIEALILEGSLRSGDSLLSEREMALQVDVSRPTLRQGLKILEDKGLLVSDPDGGRRVAPLATSITDPLVELISEHGEVVEDYLELRATLERMAAELAATRANDVDRATLTRCMERIDRAHDEAEASNEADADADLHAGLYEASHNIVLLHIMRALSGMLRKGIFHNRQKLYARGEVRDVLRDQHQAIYDAVMARDPATAGKAAQDHMLYTRRVMNEIAAAETRLEVSLRRIQGGHLTARGS